MRKKRALKNIFFSFVLELVNVLSNMILPQMILQSFGSETNGLINSIGTFIGYVTLLQLGVGSVIKAALYKPLAEHDRTKVSVVVKTTETFFRKIGFVSIIYILVLSLIFPLFIANGFEFVYTVLLVIIIGAATVAQYMFGITYEMLLESDQKSYVYSTIQIISIIINTILCVVLIKAGTSIHVVKLASASVFLAKPILLKIYVKSKYQIDDNARVDNRIISQRWDGFAQGLAYFIHSKTDVFILTLFTSFKDVSIYSVYALVTSGLSSVINAIDKAVRSALGNIIAKAEGDNLYESFNAYYNLIHMFSTVCFSTAIVTVYGFIMVYVKNISDANYNQPLFATLIISAEFIYCLRMPYNSVVFAAGMFKETKKSAFIEAIINIVISILLVNQMGLVGVAIGTIVAMIYRTVYFIIFLHNNIIYLDYKSQIIRFFTTFISYAFSFLLMNYFTFIPNNLISWAAYAFIIMLVTVIIVCTINLVFMRKQTTTAIKKLFRKRTE